MGENIIITVRDAMNINNVLNLDFSKFIGFSVETIDINLSNMFLNSLWREFNLELSPKGMEKCPWAYFPQKITGSKRSISYFGSMRTKIGFIHVAISYKIKGRIDKIYFFSYNFESTDTKIKSLLKGIVKKAKRNIDVKFKYTARCNLIGRYESLKNTYLLSEYNGNNFSIFNENDLSYIEFIVYGQDLFDAKRITEAKLQHIVDFLSVETNIYFEYSDINVELKEEKKSTDETKVEHVYQENIDFSDSSLENKFIDFYPEYKGRIILSKKGVDFIDSIISSIKEDIKVNLFLKGCYHFRQGLEREYHLETRPLEIGKEAVLKASKINQPKRQGIIDASVTNYLSSIETVTLIYAEPQKCQSCGQLKFQINKRVYDFINTYLLDDYGDIFRKIYDLRSKYLHAGESYTSNSVGDTRPLIDDKTGTGCMDFGFITMSIKGNNIGFSIDNIREWTSYALRNFYRSVLDINKS